MWFLVGQITSYIWDEQSQMFENILSCQKSEIGCRKSDTYVPDICQERQERRECKIFGWV